MALSITDLLTAPIIELDVTDSTNNYAMQLIDADKALAGTTITAAMQTGGRGQRGRQWAAAAGESLLMSLIMRPEQGLEQQFSFSAGVAVAVATALENLHEHWNVRVKWPNDIIINDKKAGGILIENILRGSQWTHAVIGLGLNLLQDSFPAELPNAISLKMASGNQFNADVMRDAIRKSIFELLAENPTPEDIMRRYNEYLYRRSAEQSFRQGEDEWQGIIIKANADGRLMVQLENGSIAHYVHGDVEWVW